MEFGMLARNMAVSGVCLSVKCWLNLYLIKEYGEMLKLEIDSESRTMNVEVLLKVSPPAYTGPLPAGF